MIEIIIAAIVGVFVDSLFGIAVMAILSYYRVTKLENENAALRRRLMKKDGVIFYEQREEEK